MSLLPNVFEWPATRPWNTALALGTVDKAVDAARRPLVNAPTPSFNWPLVASQWRNRNSGFVAQLLQLRMRRYLRMR